MQSNKNSKTMILKEITNEEWALIKTIRDYRKAYPNGSRMLEREINDILDELMDLDYKEENEEKENTEK